MAKYRKKPIIIEASQWYPPEDSRHNPAHKVGCKVGMADIGTITVMTPDVVNKFYSMKTVSGWVKLEPGDWIIIGPPTEKHSRDWYPCKPDVFEATYDPVMHRVMVCGADCHPGDSTCNNYCNLAPQKGPMAKHPPDGPDKEAANATD